MATLAPRVVKVFIASPSDLVVERRAFKEVVDELNGGYGRGAHVTFDPLGWEDALATTGRRVQSVINQDIDACDVFALVMWRRWGQKAPDAGRYSSYTEEEFYRALARFGEERKPNIFVFFKNIDLGQIVDPGPQLRKVLAFRRKLEKTRTVLYRTFEDETSFRGEIDKHLIAFVEGKCDTTGRDQSLSVAVDADWVELDRQRKKLEGAVAELKKLRAAARRGEEQSERIRAEAKDAVARADAAERLAEAASAAQSLALAEGAARATLNGRFEQARERFAKALDGTTNLRVLFHGFEFFHRIGEFAEAERIVRRCLAISGPDSKTADAAAAYGNLGLLLQTRSDLEGAETMHRKALEISEKLGRLDGVADCCGNLGLILQSRGDLNAAEAMHRRSLTINQKLGSREGIAGDYANLGAVLQTRGRLKSAESMFQKSLELNQNLGRLEGVAAAYANLGLVFEARDKLEKAELMLRKSLEIEEKLGRLPSMASDYDNLGIVLRRRGELREAETMHRKALEINEKLGRLEGIANCYGNLGTLLQARGDLEEAQRMLRKSLEIEEQLGRIEGMANGYGNLGSTHEASGDMGGAIENWSRSRDLFVRLGAADRAKRVQGWIDALSKQKETRRWMKRRSKSTRKSAE